MNKQKIMDFVSAHHVTLIVMLAVLGIAGFTYAKYGEGIGLPIAIVAGLFVAWQIVDTKFNSTTTDQPDAKRYLVSLAKTGGAVSQGEADAVLAHAQSIGLTGVVIAPNASIPTDHAQPKETHWTFGAWGEAVSRALAMVLLVGLTLYFGVPMGDRPLTPAQQAARDAANRLRGQPTGNSIVLPDSVMQGVSISADGKTLVVPVLPGVRWAVVSDELPEPGDWIDNGHQTTFYSIKTDGTVITLTVAGKDDRLTNPGVYQVYTGSRPPSKATPVKNIK